MNDCKLWKSTSIELKFIELTWTSLTRFLRPGFITLFCGGGGEGALRLPSMEGSVLSPPAPPQVMVVSISPSRFMKYVVSVSSGMMFGSDLEFICVSSLTLWRWILQTYKCILCQNTLRSRYQSHGRYLDPHKQRGSLSIRPRYQSSGNDCSLLNLKLVIDRNLNLAETEMNLNFGSAILQPKPKPKFRSKSCRNRNISAATNDFILLNLPSLSKTHEKHNFISTKVFF